MVIANLLWGLLALVVVAAAVLFALWSSTSAAAPGQRSLRKLLTLDSPEPPDISTRPDAIPTLTRVLARTSLGRRLQLSIIRAGWPLRPSELVAMSVMAGAVGWLVGTFVGRLAGGVTGALLLAMLPWIAMEICQNNRKQALMRQLPDALDQMCASLRAGYGFSQALKAVGERTPWPLGQEARRVVDELAMGLSLHEALDRMILRTDQADLAVMCTAVQVQNRTGGSLGEVISNIGEVIRERIRLAGEVAALTAEGRLSAGVLIVLPPCMAVLLAVMRPGWLDPLVTDPLGRLILLGGSVSFLLGIYVLNKLVKIDL